MALVSNVLYVHKKSSITGPPLDESAWLYWRFFRQFRRVRPPSWSSRRSLFGFAELGRVVRTVRVRGSARSFVRSRFFLWFPPTKLRPPVVVFGNDFLMSLEPPPPPPPPAPPPKNKNDAVIGPSSVLFLASFFLSLFDSFVCWWALNWRAECD